jgi:hypothetical protein
MGFAASDRISVHDLPFHCELKSPAQNSLSVLDHQRAEAPVAERFHPNINVPWFEFD